jgi:hypothetical protein
MSSQLRVPLLVVAHRRLVAAPQRPAPLQQPVVARHLAVAAHRLVEETIRDQQRHRRSRQLGVVQPAEVGTRLRLVASQVSPGVQEVPLKSDEHRRSIARRAAR